MSNTLTNLIPDAFAALDVVSRELVGFIPAVSRDPSADRVKVGQSPRIEQTPANAAGKDTTPAMAFPAASDQTIGNKSLTITKSRAFPFSWNGEEQAAVQLGPGFLTIKQDQIAQAFRAAINEMETDIAAAAYKGASRAYGTAGTAPFAADLGPTANLRKILDDNGAPPSDRSLVIDTTAGVKVRTLVQLTNVNQSGNASALRNGDLINVHGFGFRESAQVKPVTKGTGSAYVTSGSLGPGTTAIPVVTGSGTILAGDVVTFAADANNKYVVAAGIAAPGTFTIGAPGLLVTIPTGNAVTIGANFTPNVAFARNGILLGTRLPMIPAEGDLASDRMTVTDPVTGISFEFAVYPGYRMVLYEVAVAWGVAAIKPEHIAILLG
jgi:hypothetical protein